MVDWEGKKPLKGLRQNEGGGLSGSFALWKSSLTLLPCFPSLLTV